MDEREIRLRFKVMCKELGKQSDRGAAVVGMAFMDELLGLLLRSRFAQTDEKTDAMFRPGAGLLLPISAKIKMAFAIGCITAEVRDELERLTHIRNKFAHYLSDDGHTECVPRTFKTRQIIDLCSTLKVLARLRGCSAQDMANTDAREQYCTTVFVLASWIQTAVARGGGVG